ncbi:MAG TPA: hypothetical protein VLL52_25875 [Anaerolineae bacterium]|nr:hypothetical protein [Anaerolineae bacterium]
MTLIYTNEFLEISQVVEVRDENGKFFGYGNIADDAAIAVGDSVGFAEEIEDFGEADPHAVLNADGCVITVAGIA